MNLSTRRLSFFAIVLAFGLIGFGEIVPDLKDGAAITTYRAIAAILGVITVILYVKILRAKVSLPTRKAANWMMVLFSVQVLLEAFGVWFEVSSLVIAGHLIIKVLFLACVLVIWGRTGSFNYASLNYEQHKNLTVHLSIFLGLVMFTLFVGAYVRHASIGTSCGWLVCGDSLVPKTGPQLFQTTHRMLQMILVVYSLLLMNWSVTKGWGEQLQKRFKLVSMTVVIIAILGILTIVNHAEIRLAILHVAVGLLLFAFVVEARLFISTIVMKKGKIILFSTKHMLPKKNGKLKKDIGHHKRARL